MTDSENRLIHNAKAGNKRAFSKLVKRHQERVLFLAYDLVGNWEDAKDLAQEVFLRAFQRLPQFQEKAKFTTWLHRITVNLAYDWRRKKKKHTLYSLESEMNPAERSAALSLSDDSPLPDSPIESSEFWQEIEKIIKKLSPNQRTAITLRYFHQNSIKEIAEVLDCAESTVRIHIFRALTHLREILPRLNFMEK